MAVAKNKAQKYYWFLFVGAAHIISAFILLGISMVPFPLFLILQNTGTITLEMAAAYPNWTITILFGTGTLFPFVVTAALGLFASGIRELNLFFRGVPNQMSASTSVAAPAPAPVPPSTTVATGTP